MSKQTLPSQIVAAALYALKDGVSVSLETLELALDDLPLDGLTLLTLHEQETVLAACCERLEDSEDMHPLLNGVYVAYDNVYGEILDRTCCPGCGAAECDDLTPGCLDMGGCGHALASMCPDDMTPQNMLDERDRLLALEWKGQGHWQRINVLRRRIHACPGCGALDGDLNPQCDHNQGCGMWRHELTPSQYFVAL
jgi:hypothetical protein